MHICHSVSNWDAKHFHLSDFFFLLSLSFEWNCHWNFKILGELKELYHPQEETYYESTVKKFNCFTCGSVFNCKTSFQNLRR